MERVRAPPTREGEEAASLRGAAATAAAAAADTRIPLLLPLVPLLLLLE